MILCTVPYLYIDSSLVHSGSSNILMVKPFWLVFIDLQCDGTLKQDSFFCVCTSTCVPEDILVWAGQGRRVRGWKDVLNATDLLIKPALWMFLKLPLCHADYFSSLFFAAKLYNQRWIAFWWVFDINENLIHKVEFSRKVDSQISVKNTVVLDILT